MNIVVAIDSFKGSLSSLEAGQAIKEGILKANSSCAVTIRPLADGGEGTVEAICLGLNGKMETVSVSGPLLEPVNASYCVLEEENCAVIEMAAAAGITLVGEDKRNPLYTSTFGVGEMINDAINKGCRKFIIGIGGSATNDGGIGMLQALGFEFLDKNGSPVPPYAYGLKDLCYIETKNANPLLKDCFFRVACDVTNPLCGENGCSAIFGPQKGATQEMILLLDSWLKNYASAVKKNFPSADENFSGAGAAGGLGFAFLTFLNSSLESGIKIILDESHLEDYIKTADLVITGEGRLDGQTVMGKAPIGVAKLAKKYNKLVLAFSGCTTDDATLCNRHGIDAYFPILQTVTTLSEALSKPVAYKNLAKTAEQAFRLIEAVKNK